VRNRAGFTLIEIATALTIVSLLVLIGIPKFNDAMARENVRGARTTVINMLAKARATATQTGRRTYLVRGGDRAWIVTRASPSGTVFDTVGVVEDLSSRYGVTLTVSGSDSVRFDPRGMSWGGLVDTIRISKSGHRDWVAIDVLGRVTK
jgi:prepilin-type N-terminal cleavage/methylation domain-containing protein